MNKERICVNSRATFKMIAILAIYGLCIAGCMYLTSFASDVRKADTVLVVGAISLVLSFISSMNYAKEHLMINFYIHEVNIIAVLSLATTVVAALSGLLSGEETSILRNVVYCLLVLVFFILLIKDSKK